MDLSNPLPAGLATLGARAQTSVTINDDEPTLRLNSTLYTVGETGANTSFNVTILRAGATTSPVSATLVPLETGAATGGTCGGGEADFATSPILVNLAAGQASKTVQVPICADTRAEGPESFSVQLQNPVGATLANPSMATVSLTDNDVAGTLRWSAADAIGVEGSTVALTVTRTGGTASDVTVEVTALDGDGDTPGADAVAGVDYEVVTSSPVSFGPSVSSQIVEIALLPRPDAQGPRAFRVTLHDANSQAALGAPSTVTVWILDPSG
jgi:Calx-beta domain-containing protein